MDRRSTLALLGVMSAGTLAGMPAAAFEDAGSPSSPIKDRVRHRTYRGKMLYLTDGIGEQGREWFTVTIQPDGTRTMRAQVEMDNIRLLRDVILTVDRDFSPIDAFVRIVREEKLLGSAWYLFSSHDAECEGQTATEGRFSHKFTSAERINLFTAHPVHCDAWLWASARRSPTHELYPWFNISLDPNGATAPSLIKMVPGHVIAKPIGPERISVRAGGFDTFHFQLASLLDTSPPLNTWVFGEDCIPVRLRSEYHHQTYELVELTGDPK